MAKPKQLKVTNGIHSSSSRTPDKVAVRHGDRFVTYKQLTDAMRRVSYAAFTDIRFQGNAAIIANNSIEFLEILLGLGDVGVPVITINPKSTPREIIAALTQCKVNVIFIDKKLYREEFKALAELVITIGEEYKSWLLEHNPLTMYPQISDDATFNIVYSSGTTGKPKGIIISHKSRTMSFIQMALDFGWSTVDEVMLCFASLSNGGGNASAIAILNNGGTIILATQVHPDYIMRMIETHKVTSMFTVPAVTDMIVTTPSCHKYDISSLRSIVSIAAPFPTLLKDKAVELFGNKIYDLYGTTEHGPVTVLRPNDFKRGIDSVGVPVTGCVVEIRREDGSIADVGEVGEIFASGQTGFSGYYMDTHTTRYDLITVDNEFVSAGDLGYIGQDGFLRIVGRKNDMIITGGNNVYPEEVEAVLNSCPGIIESAVIGTPDDRWGEIVTAFIVGMPMTDPYEYCKDNLASYKIPRKVSYVDSIPKNETGKILRRKLREQL